MIQMPSPVIASGPCGTGGVAGAAVSAGDGVRWLFMVCRGDGSWRRSRWLWGGGFCCGERGELALERLDGAAAPAVSDGRRRGVGEDVLLVVVHRVEDGSRDGLRSGLRYVESPGHVGVGGAGQDGMNPHARPASRARSDWVMENAAAVEIE